MNPEVALGGHEPAARTQFSIASAAVASRPRLMVVTARSLCLVPDLPRDDELLGPLVVRGQRLVIGAHTGEGKTTLALQIVRAVLAGESFLDWHGCGNSRALIVDAEQGLRTIRIRLREARLDERSDLDYLRVPDGLALGSDPDDEAALEQVLGRGYDLVVLDPLYKLHAGDSNDERQAVDLMKRLDRWRDQHGFALILAAHLRKPFHGKSSVSIHDLFGSSAYVRGAEVVIGLKRFRDGRAKLDFLKDRDGDLPIGARWNLRFDRRRGFHRDPDDAKPSTREQVIALRRQDPNLTQKQVAERIGVSDRWVREHWHAHETLNDVAGNGCS